MAMRSLVTVPFRPLIQNGGRIDVYAVLSVIEPVWLLVWSWMFFILYAMVCLGTCYDRIPCQWFLLFWRPCNPLLRSTTIPSHHLSMKSSLASFFRWTCLLPLLRHCFAQISLSDGFEVAPAAILKTRMRPSSCVFPIAWSQVLCPRN